MGVKALTTGLFALSSLSTAYAGLDSTFFKLFDTIEKDVVIIGGGASGSHAAVRLREDYGKSVVVIEKEALLGGHVDTYYGDKTGVPRDYGVQVYFEYEDALDFIKRFNCTLVPGLAPSGPSTTKYVDFSTGKALVNFTEPDAGVVTSAIIAMHDVLVSKGYDKMIEPGFWNLPPGPQIPDDLLLPVSQFAAKYNVTPALSRMYQSTGGGPAAQQQRFQDVMTLTFLQSFSPAWMRVFWGEVGMYHIDGGNQGLYDKIAALLGKDVLYNTVVLGAQRTDAGVTLLVSGAQGTKVIKAKKLLVAVPPTRENLLPFDLNAAETDLFSKTMYGRYGTAVVRHPSLTPGQELYNMPTSAVQDPYAPFVNNPHILSFSSYGNDTDLFSIGTSGAGTPYLLYGPPVATAVAQIELQNMANAGTIPKLNGKFLEVVEWSDHGPGGFGVSAADMRAGWMNQFYGLQGKRSTWYTGGAIAIDFSTQLWKMNDEVLKRMIAAW